MVISGISISCGFSSHLEFRSTDTSYNYSIEVVETRQCAMGCKKEGTEKEET